MNSLEQVISQLNPPQQEAATTLQGPLLILAGAGSGKTKVLTCRIANLIALGEATPQQILAVTFTNKAAREMSNRAVDLLKDLNFPLYEPMWVSTFHSICVRILRQDIHLIGYQPYFTIYDSDDQLHLIKEVMTSLKLNDKIYSPKMFQARLEEAKRLGMGSEEFKKNQRHFLDDKVSLVYENYERQMKQANALDFGDLLLKVYHLFCHHPDVLIRYQEQFQYILVDEYQDTNRIQYHLVKFLADRHRNLCVVGDEDQSIYSWRGADITNILSFEKDFPECKVIKLEQNYRSTQTIVKAASAVIQLNSQRKDKVLFTENEIGDKIIVHEDLNEYEEARFVAQTIDELIKKHRYSLQDFAIFYRTNAQSRVLEDLLRSHSITYRLIGGIRFYERKEVKDVLGYLKIILNSGDDLACKRVINTPPRGIGKTTVEVIENYALHHKISFYKAISEVVQKHLVHSGATKKLADFVQMIESLKKSATSQRLNVLYLSVLDQTNYIVRLKEEATPEAQARIENLEEFHNAIHQFESERSEDASLQNFLEEMALVSDADHQKDTQPGVTLMTLHVSKGLEFPVVFIVGCEEGLFPSRRALDDSNPMSIEEERRLAYVGMTRARRHLFLSYVQTRRVWGQEQMQSPSRFLNELPQNLVSVESRLEQPQFLKRHLHLAQKDHRPQNRDNSRFSFSRKNPPPSDDGPLDVIPDYENFRDDLSSSATYTKGMRVRHPTFGVGSIYQIEGAGDQQKISVIFSDKSFKKFVAKFARLEVV